MSSNREIVSLRKEKSLVVSRPRSKSVYFSPPPTDPSDVVDLVFIVSPKVELCVVNSLRRAVASCVKSAAFPFDPTEPPSPDMSEPGVRILENTCVMHNEMLGHRISLLPICLTPNELANFDHRNYNVELKVRNDGDNVMDVTSESFMVTDMTGAALPNARVERLFPKCSVSGDHPLIGVLKPRSACANAGIGELIHVRAVPRLGVGAEHARWSPVSTCFFKELVTEGGEKNGWMFILECLNPSLSPYYLVFLGFEFLIDQVKSLKSAPPVFEPLDAEEDGSKRFSTTIAKFDHTMGNLLQGIMYDLWIDAGKSNKVNYVGYFKRHPLIDDITFRLQIADDSDATPPSDIFMEGLNHVEKRLREIALDWIDFCGIDKMNFVRVNEFKDRP